MAIEFLALLEAGGTIQKLTGGGVLGPAMVSYDRFKNTAQCIRTGRSRLIKYPKGTEILAKGLGLQKERTALTATLSQNMVDHATPTAGIFVNAERAKRYGMIAAE